MQAPESARNGGRRYTPVRHIRAGFPPGFGRLSKVIKKLSLRKDPKTAVFSIVRENPQGTERKNYFFSFSHC